MLTIEHALTRYTDEVLAGNSNCISSILEELPSKEHKEFLESAMIIQALYSQKYTSKFESVFEMVNKRKIEIYNSMPRAVDFRGCGDDETISQVENIFREEFGDGNP